MAKVHNKFSKKAYGTKRNVDMSIIYNEDDLYMYIFILQQENRVIIILYKII